MALRAEIEAMRGDLRELRAQADRWREAQVEAFYTIYVRQVDRARYAPSAASYTI
jgi:hypothetical protein